MIMIIEYIFNISNLSIIVCFLTKPLILGILFSRVVNGFKFIDIKSPGSGIKSFSNQLQIADEFHKSIIRKLKRRRVHSSFKNNIWGVDVADMQLLSKCKKGIRYLFCVIDLFSKYARVVPLKEKK